MGTLEKYFEDLSRVLNQRGYLVGRFYSPVKIGAICPLLTVNRQKTDDYYPFKIIAKTTLLDYAEQRKLLGWSSDRDFSNSYFYLCVTD